MSERITTPFTAESTAAEVIDGIDLAGERAIVTGAASGIGAETARALASAGAEVTLAVRDVVAGRRVAAGIIASHADAAVHVALLDLADPASPVAFADAWSGPLHVLVNNAGIMALPQRRVNIAGHELQFATNHLGHFALTTALHAALAAGAADGVAAAGSLGGSRI